MKRINRAGVYTSYHNWAKNATGLDKAERILKKVRDSETAAMSGLSAEEQAQLLALTRRYVDACAAAMKKQ